MMHGAPFMLERVSGPDVEPIDLASAKRHLREFAEVTSNDADILDLIKGAREWAEDFTGRALVEQSWRLTLRGRYPYLTDGNTVTPMLGFGWFGQGEWNHWLRRREIVLRKSPIIAITSFASVDNAGVETEIDAATYEVREPKSKWPRLVPLNSAIWAIGGDLRVTFRAGFAAGVGSPDPSPDLSLVPVRFKQACKLWVEAHYDRDKDLMPLYLKVAEDVLRPERSELSMA